MLAYLRALLRDQGGASMIEYALLIALVALVAYTAAQALGIHLSALFSGAANSIGPSEIRQ